MAYAHVQSSTSVADNAVSSSSVSFSSTPTVGNLVVVGISQYRGTTPRGVARVTDNQNANFFQEDVEDEYSTAESTTSVWSSKLVAATGTYTVTVTPVRHGTADHYIGWGMAEFSGIGGANMPEFLGACPGGPSTGSTVTSLGISRTVTAGSVWVVIASQSFSGSRSYSIAGGGLTWSDVIDGVTLSAEDASNFAESHIWYAYDATGGSRTATVTVGGGLSSTFNLYDFEISGLDTTTPGDVAETEVESGTSTTHSFSGVNTSANCGIGILVATTASGNLEYVEPTNGAGWSKLVEGNNTTRRVIMARRTYGALTGETGAFSHSTARAVNQVMAFFKAATTAVPWKDVTATAESTTGDASVTAGTANAATGNLVVGVATVLNLDTDINIGDTPPSGYSQISVVENASATIGHSFVYKICTAGETSSISWAHDNTSQSGWNAGLVTYRNDTGGGTGHTQTLTGTLTTAGALAKLASVSRTGTLTSAGAVTRSTAKSVSGTLTTAGAVAHVKSVLQSLAGTLTTAGALVRLTAKSAAGTLATSGVHVYAGSKAISGALTTAGALAKTAQKAVAGTLTTAGTVSHVKVAVQALAGALTLSGAAAQSVAHVMSGALSAAGSVTRTTSKAAAGTLTTAGALSQIKVALHTLTGALTLAGVVTQTTAKGLAGGLAAVGALVRVTAKSVAGTLTTAGALDAVRAVFLTLSGTLSLAGGVAKRIEQSVGGAVGLAGAVVKSTAKGLVGALAVAGALITQLSASVIATLAADRFRIRGASERMRPGSTGDRMRPDAGTE